MTAIPTSGHADSTNRLIAWSLPTDKRLWEQQPTGHIQAFTIIASGTTEMLGLLLPATSSTPPR